MDYYNFCAIYILFLKRKKKRRNASRSALHISAVSTGSARKPAESFKNYFKSISEHKEIHKNVMIMSSAVNTFREPVRKALEKYNQYQFLWEEDREETIQVCARSVYYSEKNGQV